MTMRRFRGVGCVILTVLCLASPLGARLRAPEVAAELCSYFETVEFEWTNESHSSSDLSLHRLPVREGAPFTWEDYHRAVDGTAHTACPLIRDNWACVGDKYRDALLHTKPFNHTAFGFRTLRSSTRVFLEGNSHLAEIVVSILCADPPTKLWLIDPPTNSLMAFYQEHMALVLMMDNDKQWNSHTSSMIELLKKVEFNPSFIVLGPLNSEGPTDHANRVSEYAAAFHTSIIIESVPKLRNDCPADFKNCDTSIRGARAGHQCLPGPVVRHSEALMRWIKELQLLPDR